MFKPIIDQWFATMPVWLFAVGYFLNFIIYSVGTGLARMHSRWWLIMSMLGVLGIYQFTNVMLDYAKSGLPALIFSVSLIFLMVAISNKSSTTMEESKNE